MLLFVSHTGHWQWIYEKSFSLAQSITPFCAGSARQKQPTCIYMKLLLLTLMPVNVHGWGNNCAYCIIEVRQTAFAPCGNFTIYINWHSYSERLLEVPMCMQ